MTKFEDDFEDEEELEEDNFLSEEQVADFTCPHCKKHLQVVIAKSDSEDEGLDDEDL